MLAVTSNAMDLRSSIEKVAWPAVVSGTPAQLLALQRQFEMTQWWPERRLRKQQFRQLQLLVAHAARTVPFHAARLRAAGIDPQAPLTEEGWARLPVLTRRDVQREGERLHAGETPATHGPIEEVTTGGSTGIPVRVRKTAVDGLLWNAVHIRDEFWHREKRSGSVARVRVVPRRLSAELADRAHSTNGVTFSDWGPPAALLWQTGTFTVIDHKLPIPQQIALLQRLRPDYLYTNPSTLRLQLAHCHDTGTTLPSLRSVWTLSEVVDGSLRALCREVFGVRIVHNYTAAEVGYIALQCPSHEHFHVQSEVLMVEVLDASGRACAPGEVGRVVVTPLHSFAMPLLRYEIGDEAEVGSPCACGRGLLVLARVVGRIVDHLVLPSGQKRRPDFSHYRLSKITAIREFQVVQRSLQRIEALLVVGRPLTPAEEQTARAIFAEEFGPEFNLELTYCESIPRTEAGKLRPFISDLPRD